MSDSPFHNLRENVLLYTSRTADGLLPRDTQQSDGLEFHAHVAEMVVDSLAREKDPPFQHLMLSGEPSSGKTTELKRIATALLENEFGKQQVMPVYSELQYAVSGSTNDLWANLVSGSADPQLASIEQSKSIKYLKKAANDQGKKLVLFIDTLDILLLDGGKDIAKNWAEFLSLATEHAVNVIWTCRPYEWKFFKKEFPQKMNSVTKKISLPALSTRSLKQFPLAPDLTQTPPEETEGIDEEFMKCWDHWSIGFQSKMPLFAQRFKLKKANFRHLHESFIDILSKEFHSMFFSTIQSSNPLTLLSTQLPTSLYYSWMWETIIETMSVHYQIDQSSTATFRFRFEEWLSDNVIEQTTGSDVPKLRLRFSLGGLYDLVAQSDEASIRADDLVSLLNVAESFGLIEKYGSWFEFSHQLLFEEALYSASKRNNNSRHTNFPSIQIRSLRENIDASEGEIDENYDSVIHWMGAFYSYHPDARTQSPVLGVQWKQWVDYASRHLGKMETFYESPMDEYGEKARILRDFTTKSIKKALLLNGAPGTGKTYFCYHFLEYHLLQDTDPINWRYVTLSEPLVDHFSSGWDKYQKLEKVDHRLKRRVDRSQDLRALQSATSVFAILRNFHPKLVKGPKVISGDNRIMQQIMNGDLLGLLTFPKFKQLFNHFCESIKGNFTRPAIGDAWRDYLQCWHDPITGARIKSTKVSPQRMSLRSNDMKIFHRFVNEDLKHWKTYDQACFEASGRFLAMAPKEREKFQHDLLMIDEIQDITSPILTFLLLLSSKKMNNKRVLLTGDRFQTVNRSGFDWKSITLTCTKALTSPSFNISKAFETRLLDTIDIYSEKILPVQTLRTPWRSAPSITTFNDHLREGFGERHNIPFDDYAVEATPNMSPEAMQREDHAQVTLVMCPSEGDFETCLELLKIIEIEIGENSNTALLTPYQHELPQLDAFASFTVYNAETVKGLEFDNVVIAQPYELLYNEALSSLGLSPHKSAPMEDSRLVSWVDSNSPEASANLEKFVKDLYDNIRTRMNVMFSRAKYRMVILLRQQLGGGWLLNDSDPENPTLVIDYPNPSPEFGQIKLQSLEEPNKQSLFDALNLPKGVGDVSEGSRIERAIDEEKNSSGDSYQNIRNLWRSYVNTLSHEMPASIVRSASLLGGYVDHKNRRKENTLPPILHALRPATLDQEQVDAYAINFRKNYDYIHERFLLTLQKSVRSHGNTTPALQCSVLNFADLCSNLGKVLHELLRESASPEVYSKHPRLLQVLLKEILGIELKIDGLIKPDYLEPIPGLRILLDPKLVEQNDDSVIQLDELSLKDVEAYADEIDLDAGQKLEISVSWQMDDHNLGIHSRILGHMWLTLHHENATTLVNKTITEMENSKIETGLVKYQENSSFWNIVQEQQNSLPRGGSVTSLLARDVMWELYAAALNKEPNFVQKSDWLTGGRVIGAYPEPLAPENTFDFVIFQWFTSLENLNYPQLLHNPELVVDLHSFLSLPPNKAVSELLMLLRYDEIGALSWEGNYAHPPLVIRDLDSPRSLTPMEFWSGDIANHLGFTQTALLATSNHQITDDRFHDQGAFERELLLFNPKMNYLDTMISPTFPPTIARVYLTKFVKSCVHSFQSSNTNIKMKKKIALILQQFLRRPTRSDDSTFERFLDHETVYSREVIEHILPLLSIIESTFEMDGIGEDGWKPILPARKHSKLRAIKDSYIQVSKLGPSFKRAIEALLQVKITTDMGDGYAHNLMKTYVKLTIPFTDVPWKMDRRDNLDSIGRDDFVREHAFYWAKLLQVLDLKPEVVPLHVRVKFCPHFLLPLQYEDDKKSQRGWPKEWKDDREELIYKAIESIRRNLRNSNTGKNERKVWLSRALTYLAAPAPSRYRRQQGTRPHFSPLNIRNMSANQEGFENSYLSKNWKHKATQIYDWKKNPTRTLAIQCLLRAEKHVHALEWSVFLMLSTISLTDNRQEFKDCEVRLDSINLSRPEQMIGTSDQRPYLTTDDVSLCLVEFFRMLDDPYVELSARYSPNLLEAAVEKTSSKHNNAHPIIIPHLNLDTNYNHWLYLQAMQIEFEKEFSLLNEGHKKNWEWG
jgi:hypothetical protein